MGLPPPPAFGSPLASSIWSPMVTCATNAQRLIAVRLSPHYPGGSVTLSSSATSAERAQQMISNWGALLRPQRMCSGRARAAAVQDTAQLTTKVPDCEWCCPRFGDRAGTVPVLVLSTSYYVYDVLVQATYAVLECTSRFGKHAKAAQVQ